MTNDVDLAFAAAEAAGTLPRGFLRRSDVQRVLANYQRVMRVILDTPPSSIIGPDGNPPADRMIENLRLVPGSEGGSRPRLSENLGVQFARRKSFSISST